MRVMSKETMANIISFIDEYFCDRHTIPSAGEIAKGVGIPRATAYRYLVEMNNRGMIEYDGKSRTIITPMIRKFAPASAPCPFLGSVPCGAAQTEEENIREYISLPVSLFGKGKFYILEASGDSMVDVGIDDGDLVVIRMDCTAEVGDIVVALTEDNESTLKVFGGVDEKAERAVLEYRNQAKYPDQKIFVRQLVIQGIAKHVIKAL
ncbi:S24 family peptidase [Gemmiger sp. An50]|uniref:LexA family protein n=1 Tax=Gemmiger sp. An50 TaxID=1965639 RepID=UPI000B3720A1|nr:S24 family peptidase [Gemmiger sp. An50]OUN83781.1 repressor LexA [Gemmiger sp. An50]